MKCKYCGSEMRLDDTDFNFKGNKDNYWACDTCGATAFEKIRYGKSVSVQYQQSELNSVDEGLTKYGIKTRKCDGTYRTFSDVLVDVYDVLKKLKLELPENQYKEEKEKLAKLLYGRHSNVLNMIIED